MKVLFRTYKNSDERAGLFNAAFADLRGALRQTATDSDRARAEQAKAESEQSLERREESFQRCDTDGFLSQWAHGLNSQKMEIQRQIELQGGCEVFEALFDLRGRRVNAVLRDGQYGPYWMVIDEDGRPNGQFVNAFPARSSTLRRKGFQEGLETAPAYAALDGQGTGLSGTAWATYKRAK